MIDRYTIPPLGEIWSEQTKIDIWQTVETTAAKVKGAPPEVMQVLDACPFVDAVLVAEEEKHTRHDVVAFLNVLRNNLTPEVAGWVHRGMTSSDLVDTANAVRLGLIGKELTKRLSDLVGTLAKHSIEHWETERVARTHGQNAEASTWGYRVAEFALALDRSADVLTFGNYAAQTAKLSGPVGNYRYSTLAEEVAFARELNLNPALGATQVVTRDRLADFMYALVRIASCIEAFALEVRLGAQSQTGELSEGFGDRQQGSSAMPHKQNPITAEQLCGLAKIVRAQLVPVLEGIALWNERDLSHSSVERIAVQTATTLTHYMLVKATELVRNLVVHEGVMLANLREAGDATLSAHVKDFLISKGMHPTEAWNVVREATTLAHDRYESLRKAVELVLAARYPAETAALYEGIPGPPVAGTEHVRSHMLAMVREHEGVTVRLFWAPEGGDSEQRGWVELTDQFRDIRFE